MRTMLTISEIEFKKAYREAFKEAKKMHETLDEDDKMKLRAKHLNMIDVAFDAEMLNGILQETGKVE